MHPSPFMRQRVWDGCAAYGWLEYADDPDIHTGAITQAPQAVRRCGRGTHGMIEISESAQSHFRKLIEREALPGLGVRLAAMHPGTAKADVRLEFAEPRDLQGDEWAIDCEGFTLWLDAASVTFLDGARIDYIAQSTGGQLQIRAPGIKGEVPAESASLVERVRWLVEFEINPQLAQHRGHVSVQEVTADGVVVLRFGGGCHGCGMADVTLKQGIEKTLLEKVPGVTAVRDATDHDSGSAPYIPREVA
jgi:Fe/S biogenesis protein NfuA